MLAALCALLAACVLFSSLVVALTLLFRSERLQWAQERLHWQRERAELLNRLRPDVAQPLPGLSLVQGDGSGHFEDDEHWTKVAGNTVYPIQEERPEQ